MLPARPPCSRTTSCRPRSWHSTAEGEARQAGEIVRHYRTVVEHPAVESLTYLGIADEGAWLGAPSWLVRRGGTPKPACDGLRDLIRDESWLSPTEAATDADGRVEVGGFGGEYRISRANGSASTPVTIRAGRTGVADVRLD